MELAEDWISAGGVEIRLVTIDHFYGAGEEFLRRLSLDNVCPLYHDPESQALKRLTGSGSVPATVVTSPDGAVRKVWRSRDWSEEAIRQDLLVELTGTREGL